MMFISVNGSQTCQCVWNRVQQDYIFLYHFSSSGSIVLKSVGFLKGFLIKCLIK